MSNLPIPKDPMIAAYLQHLRERNVAAASKCAYVIRGCQWDPGRVCGKETIGINSDGYAIFFVCEDHLEQKPDVKVINDMPNVIHRVYPDGLPVDPNMMDPNIGGFHGKKED